MTDFFESCRKTQTIKEQQSLSQLESLLTAPRIQDRDWLLELLVFEVRWLGERVGSRNDGMGKVMGSRIAAGDESMIVCDGYALVTVLETMRIYWSPYED